LKTVSEELNCEFEEKNAKGLEKGSKTREKSLAAGEY